MSKRAAIAIAAAGLAVLSGCTLAPGYERPSMPVPNEWNTPVSSPASAPQTAGPTRELAWGGLFKSDKLRELVTLALEHNRDLRVAMLNVQRARELYRIQRADLLPSVDVAGSLERQRLPDSVVSSLGRSGVTEQYSASIGAAYELDVFGRIRSLNRAALQDYFAQEATQRSVRISLVAEVARAFLVLANDLALQELAQATARNQEEWFALTEQRHRLGAASTLELSQAATQVETARADVARYEGEIAQDFNALNLLVGVVVPRELLPSSADARDIVATLLPVGLPSDVLLNRPDILAAEHALQAANANIGAARAAFFPTISLTGSAGYISDELSGLFASENRTWSFVPQIAAPIFQGGRLRANARAAHVDRDIALARYEQAIQIGFREVNDALALAASLRREREARERLVEASARAFELSEALRRAGRESYLILLDAQRSHYAAQQGLIATRLAEQVNIVTLYQVLGGGENQ